MPASNTGMGDTAPQKPPVPCGERDDEEGKNGREDGIYGSGIYGNLNNNQTLNVTRVARCAFTVLIDVRLPALIW